MIKPVRQTHQHNQTLAGLYWNPCINVSFFFQTLQTFGGGISAKGDLRTSIKTLQNCCLTPGTKKKITKDQSRELQLYLTCIHLHQIYTCIHLYLLVNVKSNCFDIQEHAYMYMYVRTLWKNHAIYILAGVLFFFWYFQCEFHSFAFYLLMQKITFHWQDLWIVLLRTRKQL